jgi:glycosyltransferase involved in cell wall biosynthesis
MSKPREFHIVHAAAQLRLGAGRYVVDTAIAQHRREPGRVAVVVSDDAGAQWVSSPALLAELERAGIPVIRPGNFFSRRAASLKAAAHTMRRALLADGTWAPGAVVHAHTAMAATMARWAGAPRVVLSCHGWSLERPAEIDLQDALSYSLCDAVTSPSTHWASIVRERTAIDHVAVIPYGVDVSRIGRVQTDVPTAPRIICVGELTRRKGQDLLLAAMPDIWARLPQAELHLFGDGDLAPALRERAAALDPAGARIVFHGMVDNPWALASPFDVFVLPTRSDNQPLALIEAMSAGLPVVSTRVGGIPELVEAARCGLIAPPENIYELRMALSVLLETSPAGRRELGAGGPAYISSHFGVATHLAALDELYQPSVAGRPHPAPAVKPTLPEGPLRLYLGCDVDRRQGWVNIDSRAEVAPDVIARADRLDMFADCSIQAIEACHLLEHLPLHEARAAFKEWARVLRPGGELLLELPDFDTCVRILGEAQDAQGHDLGMLGIFGWPPGIEKFGDDWAHHWGWSPRTLSSALEANGFGRIESLPVTQTWRPAAQLSRDFRLRAIRLAAAAEVAA